jgi:hypothetical protein
MSERTTALLLYYVGNVPNGTSKKLNPISLRTHASTIIIRMENLRTQKKKSFCGRLVSCTSPKIREKELLANYDENVFCKTCYKIFTKKKGAFPLKILKDFIKEYEPKAPEIKKRKAIKNRMLEKTFRGCIPGRVSLL